MARARRNPPQAVWPWDEPPGRSARHLGKRPGPLWPLSAATVTVLAAGYGWLGEVVAGTAGAFIGCLAGLAVAGLLHLLVHRVVSGRPPPRPSPPPRD
ncbi:hypothetical protein [Streptomyces sp. NPDC088254]|uniref:hypothetical protein n=1 Tax=Streptomyces sp. NPDC088254 TaxID=3365847 RepID=UPI0037F499AD